MKTRPEALTYKWHFDKNPIFPSDDEYEGSTTQNLTIKNFLSKHKGDYKCIATDASGRVYESNCATLEIGKLSVK